MALPIPKYISGPVGSSASLEYEWNDAFPARAYADEVVPLENKIAKLQFRAVLGLAAAFGEWTVFRLAHLTDASLAVQYIEAIWASIVDWRYASGLEVPPRDRWKGQARGPLRATMFVLEEASTNARGSEPNAYDAVCLSNLAEHVLPDSKAFRNWRRTVLDRLLPLYPYSRKDELGPPVPREAYDPAFDFKVAMTKDLTTRYLKGLDFSKNPYLKKF
jgi:hypothetical protein